jgi:hypothetical protein
MKSITITYDETNSSLNLNTAGFTDAETLVILREAEGKVRDKVIEDLKKKNTGILLPHLMRPSGA